jgi:dephospho-CoA kinase
MLSVGLTGNVAAGKSTVLAQFARLGATAIDADQIVREVQAAGSPTLAAMVDRFGGEILRPDGELDRAQLRSTVMNDGEALEALNTLVHPAVQQRRTQLMREAEDRGDRVVVNDIPLLFEVLDPDNFDLIVLVDAPERTRLDRLISDRGLEEGEARRLMRAQLPSGTKRGRSDFVIDNTGSREHLEAEVRRVWGRILDRAG